MRIINVTSHDLDFMNPKTGETFCVRPNGVHIKVESIFTLVRRENNIDFVNVRFLPSRDGYSQIYRLMERNPDSLIVGSSVAAQTYCGKVHGVVPVLNLGLRTKVAHAAKFVVHEWSKK